MPIGEKAARTNGAEPEVEGDGKRWEGYSNYQNTSWRVVQAVDDALDAYARVDSAHTEGAPMPPDVAAVARANIQKAAMRLLPELENDRDDVDLYDEILNRWQETDDGLGYIQLFDGLALSQERPSWLHQFVIDIRKAAWELGYLKAGRTAKTEPENPDEAEVKDMFRD